MPLGQPEVTCPRLPSAKVWELNFFQYHADWVGEIVERLAGRETHYNISCFLPAYRFAPLVSAVSELVGGLELHQLRGVYLPSGNECVAHSHMSQRVVLYMPQSHRCKLGFSRPSEMVDTVEGRAVDIAQGREHWVTPNITEEPRITMALMFDV